ncbi:MAG: serine/threonine-protein kinase [Vicinamibacteria bacterium]
MTPGPSSPATSAAPAGRGRPHIGRFVVISRIGRGGMGMVYRGLDEALDRELAIKTLTGEGLAEEENRQRFEIEAKAAAKLQHPNIVTVYELGEDRGVPFIAMELLPGSDLETLLRAEGELALHEKLDIVIQVCRGLAFAHDHRIVHRDIKPSNIRLLDDGTVKIMDFGIAKLGATNVTRAGMMVGTMNYMSPEQIRGLPLDGRSDVFSLGVILYQLLAGRRPFVGKGGPDVLYKIVQDETPALGVDLGPETARLEAIVRRALEKEPDNRYPTASALAEELVEVRASWARTHVPPAAPEEAEAVTAARRALREGRYEEATGRLQTLLEKRPLALEARRALRAARRAQQAHLQPEAPAEQDFPELDATFRSSRTQTSPDTLVRAQLDQGKTATVASTAAAAGGGRWLLIGAAALLVFSVGVGLMLLGGEGQAPAGRATAPTSLVGEPGPGAAPVATVPAEGAPAPARVSKPLPPRVVRLRVESVPDGALVAVDGKRAGATPQEIALDPGADHVISFSKDGFVTRELKLAGGKLPPSVQATLEPAGPPAILTLVSVYPVDVTLKGRSLAKGAASPRVSLPPGRNLVTVSSATHFLKREYTVDAKPGASVGLELPGLGRISIKANPDNCEVLIDGDFVDYPPILDRPIVEGSHLVAFKWPDGLRREQRIEVARGGIAYVTGRRE